MMASNVEKRSLGSTGIKITPIGLGVMQFAGGQGVFRFMFPAIPQSEMNEIVKVAWEGGINWFDTAEMYGRGYSENGLATALKANAISDEQARIATKWLPLLRTARSIPRTIHHRLHFLGGYSIDLYQVHQPTSFSSVEAQMNAMADLVEAGKVRSVGVSNFSAADMRRAHAALEKRGLPLASNQVQYSLLDRSIESNGVLDIAKELGVTIIAWGPIASGVLSGKFHRDPDLLPKTPLGRRRMAQARLERSRELVGVLEEIAAAHQVSAAQVALNWLIHFHGDTVVAIPGASQVKHAREAAEVMGFRLTDAEMVRLDLVSQRFK
jgi:aryl-alcohol dehydrogenase-like predicted oxidoreductase